MEETEAQQRTPGRPRDEATKDRILTAALELLQEVGFADVTCDAIANRSGASKATIYRWWPNKAAVLIEAFVRNISPEVPLHEAHSLEEWVTVHVQQFAKILAGKNGRLLSAIIAAAQSDPEVRSAFLSHWINPRRPLWRKALEKFQDEGALAKDVDIDVILDAMYGPLYYVLIVRHGKPTPAYAERLARSLLNGCVPRK